jgi:adenosylhomocysteine nucleosidase
MRRMERLAFFAALRWECAPILRTMRRVRRARLDGFSAWQAAQDGRELWLIKTGMGPERAAAAAAVASQQGSFDCFVSTGCAGALAPDLVPGDLAVATTVISTPSGAHFETDAAYSRRIHAAAARAALRTTIGPVLSSPTALVTPAAKQAVAAATGTVAVEMEGAGIGACAQAAGIPFVVVRAILDTASTELHGSGMFVDPQTGAVRPWPLLRYLARRPAAAAHLLALQRMMAAAQRSLERVFARLLALA